MNEVRETRNESKKSRNSLQSSVHSPVHLHQFSNDPSRVDASAAHFAEISRASQSVKSGETDEVIKKGETVPNMYKASHNRRDNYLTTLLSNRVSEKTNVL